MFLRAIYRQHNVYCTNVDKSSNADESYYKLLPNVFIASNLEEFIYEDYYRLQGGVNCLSDLLNKTCV